MDKSKEYMKISNEKLSALISLIVAFIVLVASYFQWWDITYDGEMFTKSWVGVLFGMSIFMLLVAVILLFS